MIRILTARPQRLLDPVIEILGEKNRRQEEVLVVVPEQMTLMMEQILMKRLKLSTLFYLNVVSPTRFYDYLISRLGKGEDEPLSEIGSRMALSQVLESAENQLPYYRSTIRHKGFVGKLSSLMKDLKRGSFTPDILENLAGKTKDPLTKAKFKDLALIFQSYKELLGERFSDNEDRMVYAAHLLDQKIILEKTHLLVYGFDTLPEQMMSLLASAGGQAASLTVCLYCDQKSAPDGFLYSPVRDSIKRFCQRLKDRKLSYKWEQLPWQELDSIPPIRYLDQNLYAQGWKPWTESNAGVDLFVKFNPMQEAMAMSQRMLLLLKEGMPLNRIAVLYPENKGYEFAVSAVLKDAGIPVSIAVPLQAISHGLVRFLLSALEGMQNGWQNWSMTPLLQSGYAPVTQEEAAELMNYAFTCGIEGNRWTQPFTRGEDAAHTAYCETLRQKLMPPMIRCREALLGANTARQSARAIFGLLEETGAYATLRENQQRLAEGGFDLRAGQCGQIWQSILDLLEEMVRISDPRRIPLRYVANRMRAGFEEIRLQALPSEEATVNAGVLGHMLVEEADAVFLMGLNQGILTRETDSLLQPPERAYAEGSSGCFLGLTDQSRNLLAQLDLKRAMTLPKKNLFLSCSLRGICGEPLEMLPILKQLQESYFPSFTRLKPQRISSSRQVLNQINLGLPSQEDRLSRVKQAAGSQAGKQLCRQLTARKGARKTSITPATAEGLYGGRVVSASRLESYAGCPLQFFLEQGLKPEILQPWKPDSILSGSFRHACLDAFAKAAMRNSNFPFLPQEALDLMIRQAMEPELQRLLSGPMGDGNRNLNRLERTRRSVDAAARQLTAQLACGKFRVQHTEVQFGPGCDLPPFRVQLKDGSFVSLQGRIDRVDRCDANGEHYTQILDNKSSKKEVSPQDIELGLQLQLLLYLRAYREFYPETTPAGAYYFYVGDPMVESPTDAPEAVQEALAETFHLRGITLSEPAVLSLMDAEKAGKLAGLIKKNGELKATGNPLSREELEGLMDYAVQKAAELAGQIYQGAIAPNPAKSAKIACEYCNSKNSCYHNPDKNGYRKASAKKMDDLRTEEKKP